MERDYLYPNWTEYQDLTQKLAATLLSKEKPFDRVIGIARGGLTLGHLFSDFMRIPISTIAIQSYTDIKQQGQVTITGILHTSIKGQRVLLVDDVADTGKTLVRAEAYLRSYQPESIITATLYYKPRSIFKPNYFLVTTSKWILFPYEVTEMIILLTQKMEEEEKNKSEIQESLEKIGYTREQISFVRRHFLK